MAVPGELGDDLDLRWGAFSKLLGVDPVWSRSPVNSPRRSINLQ